MNAAIFALIFVISNALMVISRYLGSRPISSKLFGKSRTWEGFLTFFASATILLSFSFGFSNAWLWAICALFGYGGTLFNSFLKRRMNFKEGENFVPFDQIDFIIFPLALNMILEFNLNFFMQAISFGFLFHFLGELILGPYFKPAFISPYKNKFLPAFFLFFLGFLTLSSVYFGNTLYFLVNPLLFGTSLGKTALFFFWLAIIFLPISLQYNSNKKNLNIKYFRVNYFACAFILFCVILAFLGYMDARELNDKYQAPNADFFSNSGAFEVHFTVYEPSKPVKYSTTSLGHNHLLKSMLCIIPITTMDFCSPVTRLALKPFILEKLLFFFIIFLAILTCYSSQSLSRLKWAIVSFCFLVATIDGGLLTPQWTLFLSLSLAMFIGNSSNLLLMRYIQYSQYLITPLSLLARNLILKGAHLPIGLDIKLLFFLLPVPFIFIKKKWIAFLLLLFMTTALVSVVNLLSMPFSPESSISFYGSPEKLSIEHEVVSTDGNVTTIRFRTENNWQAYREIFDQDKGLSFKSFLLHQECCIGVKENIAYVLSNKTFNSSVIQVLDSQITNGVLQLHYLCACTDCNLIPAIEARKYLNTEYIYYN